MLSEGEDTMFATATLVAHRGATIINRDELARYEPPEATKSWKPVKHSLIVDLMHQELERREMRVAKEESAIQREGNYLFAALTLNWLQPEECAAAIAFRHSNDRSEAMKMYASLNVFACDNMALSGDEIILNRKHTTRLNVAAELTKAFDRYRDGALVLQRNIEDLKAGPLSLGDAQRKLFEMSIAGCCRPGCSSRSPTATFPKKTAPTGACSTLVPCTPRTFPQTAISGHMPS
jgi:hypothetical protein